MPNAGNVDLCLSGKKRLEKWGAGVLSVNQGVGVQITFGNYLPFPKIGREDPLDRWFLERLEHNDGEAIQHLFTFDSDTLRGGTGEIRAWITVAGAMQHRTAVVDYIRAHHAKVGLAFAYWPSVEAAETGWAATEAMLQERY
jgi:hypothetical protein